MRTKVSLVLLLIAAMSGCLGLRGPTDGNWVIEAREINNTTGVPVHDVTRTELAQNEDVLEVVEEAYQTGEGQIFVTETEADSAIQFIEGYEAFDPENHREDQPSGVYFAYRGKTIVVKDAIHDVTKG